MHRLKKPHRTEDLFEMILVKLSAIQTMLQDRFITESLKKKLLTAAEVAKQLKVTEGTVRKWAMNNRIPHNKLGKALRFDQTKIDNWVNQRSVRVRVGNMTL